MARIQLLARSRRNGSRWPLLLAAALSVPAAAQLPTGQFVVAGCSNGTYAGAGGLFFVDPNFAPPAVTAVTGLPALVTGPGASAATQWVGAQWVVRIPSSGKLVTGNLSYPAVGTPLNAYVVTLAGSATTNVQAHSLATTATASNGSPAAALLTDERVLIAFDCYNNLGANGPLAGTLLGILDPSLAPGTPGALTAVPVSGIPPGTVTAMAVDRQASVAYVLVIAGTSSNIWSVPVPGGGIATQIASIPWLITSLTVEPGGTVLAGGCDPASVSQLFRIDPATLTVMPFPNVASPNSLVNGLCVDPVTGDLYIAMVDFAGPTSLQLLSPCTPTGVLTTLTAGPVGGWGCPTGIDMSAWLETYGAGSGATPSPNWTLGPNPGGDAIIGNNLFSLTSASAASPNILVFWGIGFAPTRQSYPPISVLVNQPLLLISGNALSLPIPANPQLAGVQLFAQCLHFTAASTMAASSGLHFTLH